MQYMPENNEHSILAGVYVELKNINEWKNDTKKILEELTRTIHEIAKSHEETRLTLKLVHELQKEVRGNTSWITRRDEHLDDIIESWRAGEIFIMQNGKNQVEENKDEIAKLKYLATGITVVGGFIWTLINFFKEPILRIFSQL